ncbi:high-affinity nitrate transporter 3.1-like [Primulina huaijiensis]|uniref:high-affinity nitrate transporter 3.1-like n=1 Tax=Primulina huaijiensis TaxID=1492673 RepID=UPI003CC71C95
MENPIFLLASILFSCWVATCYSVTFSSLQNQKTLVVTTSPQTGQVLKAGQDSITVTWSLNTTVPSGTDSDYKTVVVMICYAPVSQKDRGWRKTVDDLKKDKTCLRDIVSQPYKPSGNTFTWKVARDVPTATYFVRAYAENSAKVKVAFGQSTDSNKTTNLFQIQAISGRNVSLDISSICFSVFSILSLFGFFFMEKRKSKASQQK